MSGRRQPAASTSCLTRAARIARLVFHLGRGLVIAAWAFPRITAARRRAHIRRWSLQLLRILAIRLHVVHREGRARPRRAMLVANHVSWLDIFAIDAVLPARFVAKSEVARWPLAGWLATRAGTLYVQRARRHDTARINRDMHAALARGERVAVFPEGTTSDGTRLLKFHSSLLEPALQGGVPLLPVALRYRRPDGSICTELAYDGHRTLWDTVRRMVRVPRIECHVTILPPLVDHGHRRELARAAHDAIAQTLDLPAVSHMHTGTPADRRAAGH